MSASLVFSTQILDNSRRVTFSIEPGSDIPREIFLYINNGNGVLGEYAAICSMTEYLKTQVFVEGNVIPVFGNQFVRHSEGVIVVPLDYDLVGLKSTLVSRVRSFRSNFLSSSSSTEVIAL